MQLWTSVDESPLVETFTGLNHQVAPESESLQCDACHSENTILDFKALGMRSWRK